MARRDLLWERDLDRDLRPPRHDIDQNLNFRLQILDRCEKDPRFRELIKDLCAHSPHFVVNTFGWTLDPRNRLDPVIPFVQWDCQVRLCEGLFGSIEGKTDFFIEKSRDMGVTWNCMTAISWLWLFVDHSYSLCGSYKEARVDGASGSMMRMIDFYLERMPRFLMPEHFKPGRNRTFMKLVNPDNGAVVEGEATNPDFGRGERKTLVLFDEFARWGNRQGGMDSEAWEGAADVTATRWALSTPQGTTNHYYMLRNLYLAGTLPGDTVWFYEHPERGEGAQQDIETRVPTSNWLERERPRRTLQYIEQEVLIRYLGMGSTAFPDQQAWIDDAVRDLKDRLSAGVEEYGKPYELILNRQCGQPGKVVTGHKPWVCHEDGSTIAEWMTDPRSHDGTPGILWVFKEAPAGETWKHRWIISSDQGEGLASGDKSAIHVVDRVTMETMASWRASENATLTAEVMHYLATRLYPGAIFAPEGNPVGQQCVERLRDIYKYNLTTRILHTETIGKDREEKTDRLGFVSTRRTKPLLIENFVRSVMEDDLSINCLQTAIELLNYERTQAGKFQGAYPFHDDMVVSYLIALFAAASDQFPEPKKVGGLTNKRKDHTLQTKKSVEPNWLYMR